MEIFQKLGHTPRLHPVVAWRYYPVIITLITDFYSFDPGQEDAQNP